jgi:NAD-dependent deacetylase
MIDLNVVALTGAGASAESGVPTFRDAQTGLWARYDPQELATPEAFERNPRLVWEWYAWRRALTSKAIPNPGHLALVELERRVAHFTLLTQNVDDLHRRAGSDQVLELHGNLHRTKCSNEDVVVQDWDEDGQVPPRCRACGGPLRPDVVWFGEMLDAWIVGEAERLAGQCDVFASIGTSAQVYPAASLPLVAKRAGATVVEINVEETPVSGYADVVLREPASTGVPKLLEMLPRLRRRGT